MTNQLIFQDQNLTPVVQNNKTFLTSADIARSLGYKSDDSVTKLFSRNSDEFEREMSFTVKLTVNGINNSKRLLETRVFSLRGARLIALFAKTERAKEFRKWALDLIEKEVCEPEITPEQPAQTINEAQAEQLKSAVDARVGKVYARLWGGLNNKFGVEKYTKLNPADLEKALEFIAEFDLVDAPRANELTNTFTDSEVITMCCALKASERVFKQNKLLSEAVAQMMKVAPSLCNLHVEYQSSLSDAADIIATRRDHLISNNRVSSFLVPYLQS